MTIYTNPYTGQTISPSQVGYESLTISTNTVLSWPINGTTSSNVVANIIEVTATVASLQLQLPPATQVSVGQAVIIRNVGTGGNFAFTVTDTSGNTIVNIALSASGSVSNTYYIYLTDNTTDNGTWSNVAMGIGTSSAAAGSLAGAGLTAIANTLNENTTVTTFSTNYTFITADRATLFPWIGGAGTATLPNPILVGAGWFISVKNNGTGILTVTAVGAASAYSTVIDPLAPGNASPGGTSSVQVQIANSSIFVTDGTYWYTYALAQTNVFNYTQLVVNVNVPALTSPYQMSATFAKNIIQEFTGVLSANLLVLLPPTVQLYSFRNLTTGGYTLTFGISNTAGTAAIGTTIVVPTTQAIIAIGDGTNLYNANSATTSFISSLQLGNGTAANPSLYWVNDATTGLYSPASGNIGIAIGGASVGTIASTGFQLTVGIVGGAF
jgi:hypothetical protein